MLEHRSIRKDVFKEVDLKNYDMPLQKRMIPVRDEPPQKPVTEEYFSPPSARIEPSSRTFNMNGYINFLKTNQQSLNCKLLKEH